MCVGVNTHAFNEYEYEHDYEYQCVYTQISRRISLKFIFSFIASTLWNNIYVLHCAYIYVPQSHRNIYIYIHAKGLMLMHITL